jgi:rRNA processing protein Krr1/Pno1
MKKGAIICIQRARFFFYFFEEGEWKRKEKTPLEKFTQLEHAGPEDIRKLKDTLALRLERIAQMVEILTNAHHDWAITAKKDHILLETVTFDFTEAVKILNEHGFTNDDFVLRAEYTRKWGML